MAIGLVELGIEYYPDPTKGRPVFFGSIFVGEPDTDPEIEVNQKQITLRQEDGTEVPVMQPAVTSAGGVPIFEGSPVQILVDGNYSLKVLNQAGSQVYYIENAFNGQPLVEGDVPFRVSNVADMIALTGIEPGMRVITDGYFAGSDTGDNTYLAITNTGGPYDGGSLIDSVESPAIEFVGLFPSGLVNDVQFGAVDSADNTTEWENQLAYCQTVNREFLITVDGTLANSVNTAGVPSIRIESDITLGDDFVLSGTQDIAINGEITLDSGVTDGFTSEIFQRGSDASLTTDASSGDVVIDVSTAGITGITFGDIIVISSSEVLDPGRSNSLFSEGIRVRNWAGSTITLDRPLIFSYTTANSAKVSVFRPNKINLTGNGKITGDDASSQIGINLFYCVNSKASPPAIRDCFNALFRFSYCIDSEVSDIDGAGSRNPNSGYTSSAFGACRNVYFHRTVSLDVRHAFTTNNPSAPNAGCPVDIFVIDGVSKGTINSGDAWDTHAAAWNINFLRCSTEASLGIGFNFEAPSGSICDCRERRSDNEAYRVRNETITKGLFRLEGNSGLSCGENGYQLGNSTVGTSYSKFIIAGNEYNNAGQNGIWLQDGPSGLADKVYIDENYPTNSGAADWVFDAENTIWHDTVIPTEATETISGGVIEFMSPRITLSPQSGTTDDLDTISGGEPGQQIVVRISSSSNTITIKDITGNLQLAGDFVMDASTDRLVLEKASNGNWTELSRSDNS